MDIIRVATEEEVKTIAEKSDITAASSVLTYGGKDFAVFRNCFELDPVIFDEASTDRRKALFLMNLETAMRLQGVREIYFNIRADDESWMSIAKHWGAEPTSPTPEIRFKKVL